MPEFRYGDRVRFVSAEEADRFRIGVDEVGTVTDYSSLLPAVRFPSRRISAVPANRLVKVTDEPGAAPSDPVVRPHHYARFVIEPITFINANALPYNIGNVVKYACRYDAKNGVEDLRKAKRYLEIHIETLERQGRVAGGENAADVWKEAL